jgi:hypothetical protein
VSRLTEARAALDVLEAELDDAAVPASLFAELRRVDFALKRMAQLEKVAELARAAVESELGTDASGPVWLLELGLTELDNHPDTREPQLIAELVTPIQDPIDQALADGFARMNRARNPSAEAAARRAWDSWRDQRGPSVTEAP